MLSTRMSTMHNPTHQPVDLSATRTHTHRPQPAARVLHTLSAPLTCQTPCLLLPGVHSGTDPDGGRCTITGVGTCVHNCRRYVCVVSSTAGGLDSKAPANMACQPSSAAALLEVLGVVLLEVLGVVLLEVLGVVRLRRLEPLRAVRPQLLRSEGAAGSGTDEGDRAWFRGSGAGKAGGRKEPHLQGSVRPSSCLPARLPYIPYYGAPLSCPLSRRLTLMARSS